MSQTPGGEPDLAAVAAAFADPRRIRILSALSDGRALPAGRLAQEAGVAAATTSSHLAHLLTHGLLIVEQRGRHRYYRLSSSHVEGVLEALAIVAPRQPISSLREHTRLRALRSARTCYGHLAGQLGVRLFHGMIARGWVTGHDGPQHLDDGTGRLTAPGKTHIYRITDYGAAALADWGLPGRLLQSRNPLSYCVDWTEQAHHLAGPLGSALATQMLESNWIKRGKVPRSIVVTHVGAQHLSDITVPDEKAVEGGPPSNHGRSNSGTAHLR
jgi:DNA-binding transcriptional ArsR family regulator